MAASDYFNREASQESKYSLGKCYNLNMKIPHTELFLGEYLFLGGITLLQVNKYSRSSYFPINNYWGYVFPRHCVNSVCIWSYSGPYFPGFRLNSESLRTV